MANLPTYIFLTEVLAKWEKLYRLFGRGYGYIAHHPNIEAEVLGLLMGIDTAFIEGTELEREYKTFPTLFINFLSAFQDAHQTITLGCIAKARYQDWFEYLGLTESVANNRKNAVKFANEQVSLLVREREKLVEHLALIKTYFEHDSNDIVMKFRYDWLEERLEDIMMDIVLKRALIENLEFAVENYEASVAKLKEKCNLLFLKFANLNSQSARCR